MGRCLLLVANRDAARACLHQPQAPSCIKKACSTSTTHTTALCLHKIAHILARSPLEAPTESSCAQLLSATTRNRRPLPRQNTALALFCSTTTSSIHCIRASTLCLPHVRSHSHLTRRPPPLDSPRTQRPAFASRPALQLASSQSLRSIITTPAIYPGSDNPNTLAASGGPSQWLQKSPTN